MRISPPADCVGLVFHGLWSLLVRGCKWSYDNTLCIECYRLLQGVCLHILEIIRISFEVNISRYLDGFGCLGCLAAAPAAGVCLPSVVRARGQESQQGQGRLVSTLPAVAATADGRQGAGGLPIRCRYGRIVAAQT